MENDGASSSDNISGSFNSSTYSADEEVIQQRGIKRKLERDGDLASPHIYQQQDQIQESNTSRFERRRSILRTPIKKRLKFMHYSKKKENIKRRARSC